MAESGLAGLAPAGQKTARRKLLPIVEILTLAVTVILPFVLQDYLTVFATRVAILALFALSFDLVWGYAGIMSFGQALFFGSAGYGVALLGRDLNITSILVVLPAGMLIGLVFSLLLGGFLLLGRHPASVIFVSLGTLTGSYAADRLARGWYYLGGQNGIPSIPSMTIGSYEITNEQRIAFFGYKVEHLKAIVFTVGGTIAGLAGSLYAFHEGFVWPNMLGVVFSTQVVLYGLFGGSGTLIGAVIGAIIIEGVSFWLSDNYRDIWPILLGVLLLLVILFRPLGLISFVLGERERVGSFGRAPKESTHAAP